VQGVLKVARLISKKVLESNLEMTDKLGLVLGFSFRNPKSIGF